MLSRKCFHRPSSSHADLLFPLYRKIYEKFLLKPALLAWAARPICSSTLPAVIS